MLDQSHLTGYRMVLHEHHSICSLKLKWLASYSCRWKNKTELFDLNLLCKKINLSWMVLTHTRFFSVLEIELRASYLPGTLPLSYIPSPKFWLFQSMVPSWWPIQSIWPQDAQGSTPVSDSMDSFYIQGNLFSLSYQSIRYKYNVYFWLTTVKAINMLTKHFPLTETFRTKWHYTHSDKAG